MPPIRGPRADLRRLRAGPGRVPQRQATFALQVGGDRATMSGGVVNLSTDASLGYGMNASGNQFGRYTVSGGRVAFSDLSQKQLGAQIADKPAGNEDGILGDTAA